MYKRNGKTYRLVVERDDSTAVLERLKTHIVILDVPRDLGRVFVDGAWRSFNTDRPMIEMVRQWIREQAYIWAPVHGWVDVLEQPHIYVLDGLAHIGIEPIELYDWHHAGGVVYASFSEFLNVVDPDLPIGHSLWRWYELAREDVKLLAAVCTGEVYSLVWESLDGSERGRKDGIVGRPNPRALGFEEII